LSVKIFSFAFCTLKNTKDNITQNYNFDDIYKVLSVVCNPKGVFENGRVSKTLRIQGREITAKYGKVYSEKLNNVYKLILLEFLN